MLLPGIHEAPNRRAREENESAAANNQGAHGIASIHRGVKCVFIACILFRLRIVCVLLAHHFWAWRHRHHRVCRKEPRQEHRDE